jgi:hypothetical protein
MISYGFDRAVAADAGVLELVRADAALRDALADDGIVVITGASANDLAPGKVVIDLPDGRTVNAVAVRHRYLPGYASRILVTADKAADLDIELIPVASAFISPSPLTESQRDGLEDLRVDGVGNEGEFLSIQWSSPGRRLTPFQLELILTGLALVFSLFVVGVSLALAAAESKDERDVLTIAGAPPAALARSAGVRGALLAGIGGVMAIPVGFLPVVVFSRARSRGFGSDYPIVFPGRTAVLLVLAVPAVVALASLATSSAAQRLRPVRVSTATFE